MKKIKKVIMAAAVLLTACGNGGTKEAMEITGGQEYIYAPQTGEVACTAPFTVTAGDSEKQVIWKILSSAKGVSIDENGIVTITDAYVAGDINGTDIVIQAMDAADAENTATAALHVREPQRAASFEIALPDSIKKGQRVEIALENCVDQYGEPMSAPGWDKVRWEFSQESFSVEEGQLWVRHNSVNGEAYEAVSATISGVTVEKRFIVYNREEYVPTAESLEKLMQAEIKILREVDFTQKMEVDASAYAYINENTAGLTELLVDVTELVNCGSDTEYQITVRHADGSVTTEERKAEADGTIKLALQNAEAVEVSPILRFSLGKCSQSEADGYLPVDAAEKYTGQELGAFYGIVLETAGGVNLCDENSMFVMTLPDGFYDIRITKPASGTGRSSVLINGASQGTNVGNPGTGDRTGVTPYTYLMEDVLVEGGTARISLGEKDFTLASVEVRKTPDITERRVHVYIGGDSTVSNYFPIEESEPEAGRFQTGWGQVFAQYLTEENAVTDLAGGGTYAKSWYEMAFSGVIQNGQPGDYFILQAGINDRTYSNIDEMKQYLSMMIEECQKKGITVILATAMQTPKFWKDAHGKEVGEFGKPEGSGLAAFMEAIRELAAEKDVFLVDTGALTGEWYSVVGRSYVVQNYHLYNKETGVEEDTLHLSYRGALKVAELIATSLAEQQSRGVKDGQGNTLDGLSFHPLVTYEVEHKDSAGNDVKTAVTGVQAVYERYGE